MRDARVLNYLHLHLIVFIWGFTAVLGALISIDSIPLVWWRMLLAVGMIFLYIKFKKIPISWRDRTGLPRLTGKSARNRLLSFIIAGMVIALHWVTFFGAIKASNVSVTLAMMSTGAFFTSLLEPLFTSKKFVWYESLFGIVIIAALYYIFQVETQYVLGMLLGLTSAMLSSVFTILNVGFVKEHSPSTISFYELLSGTLLLSLFFIFLPIDFVVPQALTQMDWVYLLILSSVCTAYAFIVGVKVMKYLSAYTVMLTTNLEPVYGIILAFAILGDSEQMTPEFYIGAVAILLVIITNGVIKTKFSKKRDH